MSTLEPQTSAKVRITTTKGVIDIELWAKETPITSRAFLTNVLNGKFDGWEFNRVVDGFLVQIGGELNQEPFADEFNTRIRYVKRGIIGSVNLGTRNSNTGKFFITLKETPELQNKSTAFGKVVGDGIFTVLRIAEGEKGDDEETPLYPVKVTSSEVLVPYFEDLVKDEIVEAVPTRKNNSDKKSKSKKKLKVKLSLGDEEDEEDTPINIKMKSAHDVLNDKKLAKKEVTPVAVEKTEPEYTKEEHTEQTTETEQERTQKLEKVKEDIEKLKGDLHQVPAKEQKQESIVDKQRELCLSKNLQSKLSSKHSKELREAETLKLLQSFQQKIHSTPKSKESSAKPDSIETTKTNKSTEENFDDDFDNLDDSDSDSDIYSHALKFDENENNKALANEDLLITIDDSKQDQLKKKRDNDFYRNVESTSILSKRQKK